MIAIDRRSTVRFDDRRRFFRHRSPSAVLCRPCTTLVCPDHWRGELRDISFDSLGLCLPRRFELGTLLVLELSRTASGLVTTTLAWVERITPFHDDRWVLGCKLGKTLSADDLRGHLLPAPTPAPILPPPLPRPALRWSALRRAKLEALRLQMHFQRRSPALCS